MLYELIEGDIKNRNTIVPEAQIEMAPYPGERYLSMFGFDHTITDWIKVNKSVSGFNGNYSCKYLYFDVDNENLNTSLESARETIVQLYGQLNVNPKQLFISFSGSKGFHIGLHQRLFGGFEASKKLPDLIKVLSVEILASCYNTTLPDIDRLLKGSKVKVFKDIDLGIYNANRIFRAINSVNKKTGLYKIGLTSDELLTLNIEQIKELAREPRKDYKLETPISALIPNEDLVSLWSNALKFDPATYLKEVAATTNTKASSGNFFSPPVTGARNKDLFAQACMLFDHSDFNEESVRQLIQCINLAGASPLPEDEIRTLVRSAAKRTANNEKAQIKANTDTIETFNDWWDEWVDYYTADSKKLSSCFRDIDEDQEFNYVGKVACVIGKGGSRKSYYVQNVLAENIVKYNARVVYSSMEMGKVEVVNRLLDIICDPEEGKSASSFLRGIVKQDKAGVRKAMKDTMAHIDEALVLSNSSFMTCEDYEKLIKKTIELYGSIDMLVVDGLSAMGGKGTETEVYSRNSLGLKELAKKYSLFILVICHCTKEAKPYDRDPKDKVRGSEKILDNCDFTVCFSQLIDEIRSEPDNLHYVSNYGHLKYYNKRGTGLTINKVYYFQSDTKKMIDNAPPIDQFPTYEKFVQEYNKKHKSKNHRDF